MIAMKYNVYMDGSREWSVVSLSLHNYEHRYAREFNVQYGRALCIKMLILC